MKTLLLGALAAVFFSSPLNASIQTKEVTYSEGIRR